MSVDRLFLPAGAMALALALTACAGASGATDDHGDGHAAEESVIDPVDGAPEVTVIATDIDFTPATIALTAGEPINVTVVNEGETLHDFTLEAAGIHVNVEPGTTKTTSVTIDDPGSYRAVCTVAGHAEAGMVIDLQVR